MDPIGPPETEFVLIDVDQNGLKIDRAACQVDTFDVNDL
jgi:hypothetical protein